MFSRQSDSIFSRLSDQSRRLKTVLTVLATVLVIAPAAALAGHQFNDVPDSNVFHDDIDWMKDNGVTKGCNPPTNDEYCPDENVSREQMAAFMHRLETENVFLPADAAPRHWAASNSTTLTIPANGPGNVVPVTVDVEVPSSGILVIEGTAVLENSSSADVEVTETTYTGAVTHLTDGKQTFGKDTLSFTGTLEVDADDDGAVGFGLQGTDLDNNPVLENIGVTAFINVTFYADGQGEVQ